MVNSVFNHTFMATHCIKYNKDICILNQRKNDFQILISLKTLWKLNQVALLMIRILIENFAINIKINMFKYGEFTEFMHLLSRKSLLKNLKKNTF